MRTRSFKRRIERFSKVQSSKEQKKEQKQEERTKERTKKKKSVPLKEKKDEERGEVEPVKPFSC